MLDSALGYGGCRIQLKEDLKTQVARWLAADQKVGVPELHRRQLLLRAGSLASPEPTALSALVIHGLHDSPKAMTDLAEGVANHSVNTFVSRMRGHFETDQFVLKRTVPWEQWLADAEADLVLAQRLGSKVVLMGHSTAALLLTWLAIRDPVKVAGLILCSAAFRVHSFAQTGAWTSYWTRIDLVTADGRVRTGHFGFGSRPDSPSVSSHWAMGCRWARPYHDQILQADASCNFAFSGGRIGLACRQIRSCPDHKRREKGRGRVGSRRSRLRKEEAPLLRRRIALERSKALRQRVECLWVVGIPIGSGRGRADVASPSFGSSSPLTGCV